ncbi:riboflavin synthase, alpha subunit [Acinetobacter schindleri NIPH 900]|uniref:Riboflavin synthase n=2 Tax=Acinetobacter schindleri TaxID=108981 RepID=N8XY68_9GAMM|nr:riboflavin synthase, alpha subunit [Acinetobacter schindleri NIPH 900]
MNLKHNGQQLCNKKTLSSYKYSNKSQRFPFTPLRLGLGDFFIWAENQAVQYNASRILYSSLQCDAIARIDVLTMYTGIVQGLEKVVEIRKGNGFVTIIVSDQQGFFADVFIGASVAVNGVCLTVTTIDREQQQIHFDISNVTLELTTLKSLKVGDEVNIERSAKVGAENGGHNLYGHIEGTAQVTQIERRGETLHIDLQIPAGNIKYFFLKGFIGLNGCSLTVNHVDRVKSEISIDLIPETLRLTTWKSVQVGDEVNYEIDQMTRTLVDTLENIHLAKG